MHSTSQTRASRQRFFLLLLRHALSRPRACLLCKQGLPRQRSLHLILAVQTRVTTRMKMTNPRTRMLGFPAGAQNGAMQQLKRRRCLLEGRQVNRQQPSVPAVTQTLKITMLTGWRLHESGVVEEQMLGEEALVPVGWLLPLYAPRMHECKRSRGRELQRLIAQTSHP